MVFQFNYYTLTACQDEATGKIRMWDTPNYMPDEESCKVGGEFNLGIWM
jgi:hypothetical protein